MTKHTIALALSLIAATASAQSTGTVQVRIVDSAGRPLDGTVTFRSGNASLLCRTVASRCSITLAAGTWSADITPTRESSAGAQSVAVSGGSVANVTFRTRPATTTPTTTPTTTTPTTTTPTTTTPTTTTPTTTTPTTTTPTTTTPTTTTPTTTTPTTTTPTTTTPTIRTQTAVAPQVRTAAVTPAVRTAPGVTTVTPTTSSTPATAPGVTATAPGVTAVTPTVTPTVAPRVANTTTTTTTTPSATPSARDLGRGSRVCAQGNVTDALGRPADATVTVTRDGATIGTVRSVAGRFSMFDLPPGRYALRAVSARDGSVAQQVLELGADVARVVVRVR